jgi:mono/diheme cytochrome c family protein
VRQAAGQLKLIDEADTARAELIKRIDVSNGELKIMSASKKSGLKILGIIVAIGLLVLAWAAIRPGPLDFAGKGVALTEYKGKVTGVPADFTETDPIARGRYLADAADCMACHTVEGGKPLAGGRAFHTDFGTIYSPNITADVETGIGSWSDADFVKAMHEGINKSGKKLYPAFPYAAYTYLTEDDVLAIKAYLFSMPAEKNTPPETKLDGIYGQRWLMGVWSAMYNPKERFTPVADRSESWNRGAYLAEALGHCGDCHTPRTPMQSLDNRNKFAGGIAEGWRAYNLSSDKDSGIGNWSEQDVVQYLRTGRAADRGTAFGPMAEAVHLSFQKLTASDVSAVVEYVKSVPAVASADLPAPKLDAASESPSEGVSGNNVRGGQLFASMCSGCHGWTGKNSYVRNSALTGNRAINDPTATNVALAILHGANPLLPDANTIVTMPAFGQAWSDTDIADVSNYVIERFGAKPSSITADDVAKLRKASSSI